MKKFVVLLVCAAAAAAALGLSQVAVSQTPTAAQIYIHVDPATGCHYIVFPSGSGVVRVRPNGAPYCETAPG